MRPIPPAGEWLRLDTYWLRREADGSISRGTPPAEPNTKQAAPVAAKGKA